MAFLVFTVVILIVIMIAAAAENFLECVAEACENWGVGLLGYREHEHPLTAGC